MKSSLMKKLNYSLPDFVKVPFSMFIRGRLIHNPEFKKQLSLLEQYEGVEDEREYIEYQYNSVRTVLIHAYEHTKYYKELFDKVKFDVYSFKCLDEMRQIPILTKRDIIENISDMISDDARDYYESTSSGSSGQPLKIFLDGNTVYKEMAFEYHFWEKWGYKYKADKMVTFRGLDFKGRISKYNPLYNEILLNPFGINDINISQYIRVIDRFNAKVIRGYASTLVNFCRLLCKNGINLKMKLAICISETVTDKWTDIISSTLGCKVISFYGHSERAVFAEQIDKSAVYRFNKLYGYTELYDNPAGNIVCTGFLSKTVPLIRYAVDDLAIPVSENMYRIIGHHSGSVVYGINGEKVTQTALNCQNQAFERVTSYQYYQEKKGFATLVFTSPEVFDDREKRALAKAVEKKTKGYLEWDAQQVEKLETTSNGKHKWVIQKMREEDLDLAYESISNNIIYNRGDQENQ